MTIKNILAKIIRVISVPPIMVTALVLILKINRSYIFCSTSDVIISIIWLGIVPCLAYLFQISVPTFREKGREAQRKLAFIFSLIGYTGAFLWSLISHVSRELLLICTTYFLSVLILTFINKVMKKRASGHACSVCGPLVFLIYFINWKLIFPCAIVALLIFWSSLYLKRHTKADLFGGIIANLIAFLLASLIIFL